MCVFVGEWIIYYMYMQASCGIGLPIYTWRIERIYISDRPIERSYYKYRERAAAATRAAYSFVNGINTGSTQLKHYIFLHIT